MKLRLIILFLCISSCITLRKAPEYFTYKVEIAKKFKRQFPKELAFIFEDPKDANQFYNYINKKFLLNDTDVGLNVPLVIDNNTYYLTYYESEIPDKKLNLLGLAIDATRLANDRDPLFNDNYVQRKGHWFIAITVFDAFDKNCLAPNHEDQKLILDYLQILQNEYLNSPY
ncbi:hypothetical protein HNV08_15680 [Winogradskyella eckloniae]|uniref:hypothetical protein n=1 Tax=Winogradskyella eckloniae TaxID=1089306 RepID=UPI00156300A2|nr:hypothetical protein [Winogradskyella eckloniae]NRD21495.1 hypothetical protein [Winogradskyella eckloniae]